MRKPGYLFFVAVIIPALLVSACSSGNVAASKAARVENTNVPSADLGSLVSGNTAFAFDLYQAIRGTNGNMIYSPYSISLAFAMAYAGARSKTAAQMADVLHYSLPQDRLHPAINALALDLARRPDQAAGVDKNDRFELTVANALWGQTGWIFLPDYLDLLARNYGAGIRLVDFKNASESARKQINDWVANQTKQRIKDIIPQGAFNPAPSLVLANAIYFNAAWEYEFQHNPDALAPFTLLSGKKVDVPMMSQEDMQSFAYASGDGWQAVDLPYKGELADMLVVVPDEGTFSGFESTLTASRWQEIVSSLQAQEVSLSMPKFSFEMPLDLADTLPTMGMRNAFDEKLADLSGMDGKPDLYISKALHKAFIAVDEKGTEAAASTVIVVAPAMAPPVKTIQLVIDRPFLFFIRDVPTGTILFMGRVVDPR